MANAQPGCCGTAARLPNWPGSQKLTPPSSARAIPENEKTDATVSAPQSNPDWAARKRLAGCSTDPNGAAIGFIGASRSDHSPRPKDYRRHAPTILGE